MKVLIPAKSISKRVTLKNFRPFYQNKSLVDIKVEQVLIAFSPTDVYLSCDDPAYSEVADRYGIHFVLRSKEYAHEEIPWPVSFAGIVSELPVSEEEDIFWTEVVNPLFSDFLLFRQTWEVKKKEGYDSMLLVSSLRKFLFNSEGHPANFLYGHWHTYSQEIRPFYSWDSVCVMQKALMLRFGYPIGRKPFFFKSESPSIDIDTLEEFNMAQTVYERTIERK